MKYPQLNGNKDLLHLICFNFFITNIIFICYSCSLVHIKFSHIFKQFIIKPCFINREFELFLEGKGTEYHKVAWVQPQANNELERQKKLIFKRSKTAQAVGFNWKKELQTYLAAYSSTINSVLGKSPAGLMFVRPVQTKLPAASFTTEIKTLNL
jgi:hypothetical protein